jgi:hypothetical protein
VCRSSSGGIAATPLMKEHCACFTKFLRLFFGFLTACFLLRVLIIITTTATTPMMLFALYLSIYVSIYQSSQFSSSVLFWPKFF